MEEHCGHRTHDYGGHACHVFKLYERIDAGLCNVARRRSVYEKGREGATYTWPTMIEYAHIPRKGNMNCAKRRM